MSDGGKGSAPRIGRDDVAYSNNWDKIFGKKESTATPILDEQRWFNAGKKAGIEEAIHKLKCIQKYDYGVNIDIEDFSYILSEFGRLLNKT